MPRLASLLTGGRGIGGTGLFRLGPAGFRASLVIALGLLASRSRRLPLHLDAACASAGELARQLARLST